MLHQISGQDINEEIQNDVAVAELSDLYNENPTNIDEDINFENEQNRDTMWC